MEASMPEKKLTAGSGSGVGEIKVLITAGAMAATLAGWAALAAESDTPAEEPAPTPPTELPASLTFLEQPLPTLVAPGLDAAATPAADAPAAALRTVSAPPPVQIVTITQKDPGSSKPPARTSSSR
jgi:hypothetical protein